MKILHVIPSLNKGGAERICLDICAELQRQGHEVRLCILHAVNRYTYITDGLDYKVTPTQLKLFLYRKNKIDVSPLQQEINSFQPDIIHSHLFEAEINLAFCQFPKHSQRIIHFHDNMIQLKNWSWENWKNKAAITNYYERHLVVRNIPQNTQCIGISDDAFAYIQKELPQLKAIKLLNAIDLKRFTINTNTLSQNTLTMIGSFVPKKGQNLAIQTVAELKKRGISIRLFLLGDGHLKEDLVVLANSLEVGAEIAFEGLVDNPEKYLQQAKIYLHTASYEPFGLVLIEAMACGVPIVCTDGRGNRDIIQEGENGFMIWERNPELLADKIQYLLEHEEQRQEMGRKANRFAQQFGMEEYVKELVDIYANKE